MVNISISGHVCVCYCTVSKDLRRGGEEILSGTKKITSWRTLSPFVEVYSMCIFWENKFLQNKSKIWSLRMKQQLSEQMLS